MVKTSFDFFQVNKKSNKKIIMHIHRKSQFKGPFAQSCIPTKLILLGKIYGIAV